MIGADFYAWMMLVFAPCSAFIGGYCYRQRVLSSGKGPRFRFLWLKECLVHRFGSAEVQSEQLVASGPWDSAGGTR